MVGIQLGCRFMEVVDRKRRARSADLRIIAPPANLNRNTFRRRHLAVVYKSDAAAAILDQRNSAVAGETDAAQRSGPDVAVVCRAFPRCARACAVGIFAEPKAESHCA